MARPLQRIIAHERYGEALIVLGVFFVLGGTAEWMAILSDLAFVVIALMITAHPAVPKRLKVLSFSAAGVSAVLTLTRAYQATDFTVALDSLSTMVVVVVTIIAILARLLQHTEVDRSTVMGAFLAYALLAFAAADLYYAVDALSREPFFAQGPQPESDYVYFSIVTLTTVGYGDLTAGSELAKRLVAVEALTGQVFLVVLVARLVSLWKAPARIKKEP
jgi:hypothetical protein